MNNSSAFIECEQIDSSSYNRVKCYPLFKKNQNDYSVEIIKMNKLFCEYEQIVPVNFNYVFNCISQLEKVIKNSREREILFSAKNDILSLCKKPQNQIRIIVLSKLFMQIVKLYAKYL